eukprot:NODE_25922_length_571_cov_2.310811.p1 GENE.NODE_25922_length_571_cov_2.310811~~NODE_25922_length_571_cov_2.310811.p1  ORF type:complete len:187 (+),score=28.84 NODE_25922_length_571_cov_2.310811:60-563(+)
MAAAQEMQVVQASATAVVVTVAMGIRTSSMQRCHPRRQGIVPCGVAEGVRAQPSNTGGDAARWDCPKRRMTRRPRRECCEFRQCSSPSVDKKRTSCLSGMESCSSPFAKDSPRHGARLLHAVGHLYPAASGPRRRGLARAAGGIPSPGLACWRMRLTSFASVEQSRL